MLLEARHQVTLRPTAPFHFDATMHKPDHFPSADNTWEPGVRWQTMRWRGRALGLKFENQGSVDRPLIDLSVWSIEALEDDFLLALCDEINYRCNLQLDLSEFNARFGDDPQLGDIFARWRGMRPFNCNSLYEYLIIAVLLQNATVRRSVNMMQVLLEQYGTPLSYDGRELYCFWEPADIDRASEEDLRRLKVGYRAKSIKRVTEAFVAGGIDELDLRQRSQDEQRKALLDLYGIGPASVWYLLFDVFHRWNELNHISPWEQKIYSRLFFGRDPNDPLPAQELLSYFDQRFGRCKMLAVHYIWEDLFWRRKNEDVPWLNELIRL